MVDVLPQLVDSVNKRNQREVHAFEAIFKAYEDVMSENQTLKAKTVELQRRCLQGPDAASLDNFQQADDGEIQTRLRKQTEELMQIYRLKNESDNALSLLHKQIVERDKQILTYKEDMEKVEREKEALMDQNRDLKRDNDRLLSSVNVLEQEIKARMTSQETQDDKIDSLRLENNRLTTQLIALKEQQIEKLNELNELAFQLQKKDQLNFTLKRGNELKQEDQKMSEARGQPASSLTKLANLITFPGRKATENTNLKSNIKEPSMSYTLDNSAWYRNIHTIIPVSCSIMWNGHGGKGINCVSLDCFSKTVLSGGSDGKLCLWATDSGDLLHSYKSGHSGPILTCGYSPDERLVFGGGTDKACRVYSSKSEKIVHTLRGHNSKITSAQFTDGSNTIVTGSYDRNVKSWDMRTGNVINTIVAPSSVNCISVSPSGDTIATAHLDSSVRFWSGKHMYHEFKELSGQATGCDFAKDGVNILVNSKSSGIYLLDIRTFKVVKKISGHSNNCSWARAQLSPDGGYCVAGSSSAAMGAQQYAVKIWDVKTGNVVKKFCEHEAPLLFWDWKEALASADRKGNIRIWL